MNRFSILLTCLLALVLSTTAFAQDTEKNVTIVTTYDLGYVWNPLDQEMQTRAPELLEEEFERFLELQENPVPINLGHTINPQMRIESAYNSSAINFFQSHDFAAVHFDSSDFTTNTNKDYGMRQRPEEMNSLFFTGLQGSKNFADQFAYNKLIEKENVSIAIGSVASKELVAGIPNMYKEASTQTFEDAESFFQKSNADLNLLVVEPDSTFSITDLEKVSSADALILIGDQDSGVFSLSSLPIFQVSKGSNFSAIKATLNGDTWSFDRVDSPWIDESVFINLKTPALPIVGMSIPPPGRLAERLGIEQSNVALEVFRDHDFSSLTSRESIYIYEVVIEDEPYRVIRTRNYVTFGWIYFDGLVVINRDNTIRQVIVNNPYMTYDEKPTRLYEAIQSVYNKPVDQWNIDLAMIAGIDHMAETHLNALRTTLEISSQIPYE